MGNAANQARCNSQGWDYSPSADMCGYTGGRDGSVQYYDPTSLQPTSAPYAAPSDWIKFGIPVMDPTPPPAYLPLPGGEMPAAAGIFDSAIAFLQTPGPFGIPYGLIGAGVVIALFVMSESGGTKKKGGGWL